MNFFTAFLPELLIVAWIITLLMRINYRFARLEKRIAAMEKKLSKPAEGLAV